MRRAWVDEAGRAAFRKAIESIEAASAAEVVIAVRHHSGSYAHADVVAGTIAGVAALAFMLLSPRFAFSTPSLLVDPLLVGVVAGLSTTQIPGLRRFLTPAAARHDRVRESARATFFERGVRSTRERTGMLVYVSLLERAVDLVCDDAVARALGDELPQIVAGLESCLRREFSSVALATKLGELAAVLGPRLPCRDDDVDELSNEVFEG